MKSSLTSSLFALAVSLATAATDATAKYPGLQVTPAFTADLTVGITLEVALESGGVRFIRPITGGTYKGPLFNATVLGGFAAPAYYDGGAQEQPQVYTFGKASDGSDFYAYEMGVGDPASWLTRVQVEVGGVYANLSNEFIVANDAADKTGSKITVPVYKVTGQGCC